MSVSSTSKELPELAREGRDQQRYSDLGERLVAGIVPLSADRASVLLIQSSRRSGWVLPKGGWETDEATAQDAARREAWEEAGIVVRITRALDPVLDRRAASDLTKHAPRAIYHFFEACVEEEKPVWPEMHKRGRRWMDWPEACEALADRPELLEALHRSSMLR